MDMDIFESVGLPEKFLAIWSFCTVLIVVDAYMRGELVAGVVGISILYGAAVGFFGLLLYEGVRKGLDRLLKRLDTEVRVGLYLSVALFSLFVSFLVFGLGVGAVGDRALSPTDNQYVSIGESELDIGGAERLVRREANKIRVEEGLGELKHDGELAEIARRHSQDMSVHGYTGHVDSEGRNQIERAREEGYECLKETHTGVGENVQATQFRERLLWHGYISSEEELAEAVVEAWVGSEGHYRNLVEENYSRHGVGVVEEGGDVYVTQKLC